MALTLKSETIDRIVAQIPGGWMAHDSPGAGPALDAGVYKDYLTGRLEAHSIFLEEAIRARSLHV